MKKLNFALLILTCLTIFVGALSKLNHWPFGKELLQVGIGMQLLFFITLFYEYVYKRKAINK